MADNPLTKLPIVGQLGVALVSAGLIYGVFHWQYLGPAFEQETKKTEQLGSLRKQIQALEVTANKLQEFQREVSLLENKLETLKQILPPEKETPDLMRKVQSLAAQSNLSIRKFTPGNTVTKDFYQEWPISMDVEGNYHNLGIFFERVGRLPRLVNMGNLKVASRSDQSVSSTINASCVATTFVYAEQAAAASGKPPAGGAK